MPKFEGFGASVVLGKVGKRDLNAMEFKEEVDEEERSTICYIVSETGKVITSVFYSLCIISDP